MNMLSKVGFNLKDTSSLISKGEVGGDQHLDRIEQGESGRKARSNFRVGFAPPPHKTKQDRIGQDRTARLQCYSNTRSFSEKGGGKGSTPMCLFFRCGCVQDVYCFFFKLQVVLTQRLPRTVTLRSYDSGGQVNLQPVPTSRTFVPSLSESYVSHHSQSVRVVLRKSYAVAFR